MMTHSFYCKIDKDSNEEKYHKLDIVYCFIFLKMHTIVYSEFIVIVFGGSSFYYNNKTGF